MTRQVIAKIKLNPGKGGYFDPITRIHLTHGDSEKPVFAGMNTTNLRKAVRDKRITITSGSLGEFTPPFKLVKNADGKVVLAPNVETKAEKVTIKEEKKTSQKKDEKKAEEKVKEAPINEETIAAPEPSVEEPAKEEVKVEEVKVEAEVETEAETEVKSEEPEAEAEAPEKEEEKAEEVGETPKKRRRKKTK